MNTWKVVSLTVLGVLLVIILLNLFKPIAPPADQTGDRTAAAYESYLEELRKKNAKYYRRTEEEMDRASAITDLGLRNQQRFEKLLDRWEKQADQMDRVLERMERGK